MPTFNTENSTSTWTAPTQSAAIDLTVRGGSGADGGDGDSENGDPGGDGGEVSGELSVSPGDSHTIHVGSTATGQSGVSTPFEGGLTGGAGGGGGPNSGDGGGGGASSAFIRDSDNAVIAVGEGGGGGGGGKNVDATGTDGGGGGGGGTRGGSGGTGGPGASGGTSGTDGSSGDGSGNGGAGGDGGGDNVNNTAGAAGGTVAHSDLSSVATASGSSPVVDITVRYSPNAPGSLSVAATRDTEIDITWTDDDSSPAGDNEDGYRVYKSLDGGATETQVADLAAGSTSYTLTGLKNGEEYTIRVEAYNAYDTASASVVGTTTLPDADQPALGNGVEDEIQVDRQTQPTNTGSVRWQVRETGESSWSGSAVGFAENTVAAGTLTFAITGREDGEEYEVRLRTETPHVTGAWTTPVSIVTLFPTPTGLSTSNVQDDSLDLSWTDNADNEDGFRIRRRELSPDTTTFSQIASLAANTTSYTDTTVQPARTYEYEVEAFTDDATATDTTTVSTDGVSAGRRPIPCRGWYVEVDHPDGTTRTVQPREDAVANPRLNDRPEVVIPVQNDDHWLATGRWERQPMRVWRDGDRLPIEEVGEVRETPGGVELVGRGGADLLQTYRQNYDDTNAHDVIRDALATTSYASTVDAAPTEANRLFATWSTTSEFDANDTFQSGLGVDFSGDTIEINRSGYLVSPVDISGGSGVTTDSTNNWTTDEAYKIDAGNTETVSWTIDLDAPLPAGSYSFELREARDEFQGYIIVKIDGNAIGADSRSSQTSANRSVSWHSYVNTLYGADGAIDLSAGQHTIEVETSIADADGLNVLTDTNGTLWLDTAVLFDARIQGGLTLSNTLDANTKLDGAPYPYYETGVSFDVDPAFRSEGGRVEATVNDTSNNWLLALFGPSGTAASSQGTTAEGDFTSDIGDWVAKTRLDGIDATSIDTNVERDITTNRTEPQIVQDLTLKYDALESPTVDGPVDDRIDRLLSNLADRGNLLWEVQYTPGTGIEIVVTQAGQRSTDADPDVATYDVEKGIENAVSAVRIKGRKQTQREESFTGSTSGTDLTFAPISAGSERVYDSLTSPVEEFARGDDYEIDYDSGTITVISSGDMSANTDYYIDYEHQPEATRSQSVPGTNEVVRALPQLKTDSECDEAAAFVLDNLDGPVWTATVRLPRSDVGFDLVDNLDPSRLPSPPSPGYDVRAIENAPQEITLELGSGRRLQAVIEDLQSLLGSTAREV